jgi:hypothetical protein
MPIRLKFRNDLSISGSSRGAGNSISQPATGGGGGFLPYGTLMSTAHGVDYSIGTETYSAYLAIFVKTQTCDVDTLADGVGGSFIDWAGASNIQYKPYGTHIADGSGIQIYPVEVPTGSGNYYNSALSDDSEEIHDGTGQAIIIPIGFDHYYSNGTPIYSHSVNNTKEIPYGSNHLEDNGLTNNYEYRWNGTGGYNDVFIGTTGSYYSSGTEISTNLRYHSIDLQSEVPSGSSYYVNNGKYNLDSYYWDGSGDYYTAFTGDTGGVYYNFGDFIYNDGSYDYYWDGSGGYYT